MRVWWQRVSQAMVCRKRRVSNIGGTGFSFPNCPCTRQRSGDITARVEGEILQAVVSSGMWWWWKGQHQPRETNHCHVACSTSKCLASDAGVPIELTLVLSSAESSNPRQVVGASCGMGGLPRTLITAQKYATRLRIVFVSIARLSVHKPLTTQPMTKQPHNFDSR